jgi:hypothetical protein
MNEKKIDCKKLIKSLNKEELVAFVETNKRIDLQNHYGTTNVIGDRKKETLITWSDGYKKWTAVHPDAGWWDGHDKDNKVELSLGPIHVLTPYPYEVVNKFAECLKTHPLYVCSFEAKKRGEVDPTAATLCWALKQLERIKKEEWQKDNR